MNLYDELSKPELLAFADGYFDCAAWADGSVESLGLDFGAPDPMFSDSARRILFLQAIRFASSWAGTIANAIDVDGYSASRAGHDFWLTRNGHGAGYWDGDLQDHIGESLTECARLAGACELYVNDADEIEVY